MRRTCLVIVMLTLSVGACATAQWSRERRALTEAELAFARANAERGQRHAWLTWFAPDGVMFHPDPINAQAYMQGDPQPPPAPPGEFDWRPVYGGMAASRDLGYNSGPVKVKTIGRSDRCFFSVWRKQPDGRWMVVVDLGTQVDLSRRDPFDDRFVAARPPERLRSKYVPVSGILIPVRRRTPVEAADLAALDRIALPGPDGFVSLLDDDVRGLRWMAEPLVGRQAFRTYLAGRGGSITHEPAGSGVSKAGDLGYTYGRYVIGPPTAETGHYARMWRLDATGVWRIAFDVARPDPPRNRQAP